MGIAYRIDTQIDCVIAVWDGHITIDDEIEHILRLADEPDWPRVRNLTDLTTVANIPTPDRQLLEVLTEGTSIREKVVKALVVRPGYLTGNWIEHSGALLTGVPTPFTDLSKACAYLGVNESEVQGVVRELRS